MKTRRIVAFLAVSLVLLALPCEGSNRFGERGVAVAQKKARRARPQATPSPTRPANRPPEWPKEMKIETKTVIKYDEKEPDRSVGATTTVTVLTPATDPDGDPLTYSWTGKGVGLTTGGLEEFDVKEEDLRGDGLTATWWRQNWSGQPASGFLGVTAKDGKGGESLHLICIGRYAQCP